MAKHGIKGTIGGGVAEGGAMDGVIQDFRAAYARIGIEKAPGEDLNVGFHFHIAPTVEQALREAAPYYEENVKMFGPLRLHRGLSEAQIRDISDPSRAPARRPADDRGRRKGRRVPGRPAGVNRREAVGAGRALPGAASRDDEPADRDAAERDP